jgi:hypothetical protein
MGFLGSVVKKGHDSFVMVPNAWAGKRVIVCPADQFGTLLNAKLPKHVAKEYQRLLRKELRVPVSSWAGSMRHHSLKSQLETLKAGGLTFADLDGISLS